MSLRISVCVGLKDEVLVLQEAWCGGVRMVELVSDWCEDGVGVVGSDWCGGVGAVEQLKEWINQVMCCIELC